LVLSVVAFTLLYLAVLTARLDLESRRALRDELAHGSMVVADASKDPGGEPGDYQP
jgi:hypothetical protein